jgi:hypothetical protein
MPSPYDLILRILSSPYAITKGDTLTEAELDGNFLHLLGIFNDPRSVIVSGNYTVLPIDQVIWVDTTSGPANITLPTLIENKMFYIADYKGNAATNPITINHAGGKNINGSPSFVLDLNYAFGIAQYNNDAPNDIFIVAVTTTNVCCSADPCAGITPAFSTTYHPSNLEFLEGEVYSQQIVIVFDKTCCVSNITASYNLTGTISGISVTGQPIIGLTENFIIVTVESDGTDSIGETGQLEIDLIGCDGTPLTDDIDIPISILANTAPNFIITPIPDLQVNAGNCINPNFEVTRLNGCSDVLFVSANTPLPTGVSIPSFNVAGNTVTFSICAALNAPLGIYPITLTAGGCSVSHTVSFNLQILPPISGPDFIIDSITDITILQTDANGAGLVTISRLGGCNDEILVTAISGLPPGITLPNFSLLGSELTKGFLVLNDLTVIPGVYTVTLEFTGCSQVKNGAFTLTVLQQLPPGITPTPDVASLEFRVNKLNESLVRVELNRVECTGNATISYTSSKVNSQIEVIGLGSYIGDFIDLIIRNPETNPIGSEILTFTVEACGDVQTFDIVVQVIDPCATVTPAVEVVNDITSINFISGLDEAIDVQFDITRVCCEASVVVSINPVDIVYVRGNYAKLTNGAIISSALIFPSSIPLAITTEEFTLGVYNEEDNPLTGVVNLEVIFTPQCPGSSPETITIPITVS